MRIVVQNTGHGGQRGAAEGTEEGAGAFPPRARGEERCLLQHHLAPGGRSAGGAPQDGAQAGRSPGGPTLRANQGRLGMGKRGNGEGSITRRKDGLYMARYTVQTATGTKRKTIYGKEREQVAEKLIDALSNRNKGLVFDAGSQTVGEYVERWLLTSAKGSVRESTYESYRKQVERYVVPAIGRVKLKRLSAIQI